MWLASIMITIIRSYRGIHLTLLSDEHPKSVDGREIDAR